jgi:hypothetical protein
MRTANCEGKKEVSISPCFLVNGRRTPPIAPKVTFCVSLGARLLLPSSNDLPPPTASTPVPAPATRQALSGTSAAASARFVRRLKPVEDVGAVEEETAGPGLSDSDEGEGGAKSSGEVDGRME